MAKSKKKSSSSSLLIVAVIVLALIGGFIGAKFGGGAEAATGSNRVRPLGGGVTQVAKGAGSRPVWL